MAGRRRLNWSKKRHDKLPRPLRLSNGDVGVIVSPLTGLTGPAGRCRFRYTEGPRKGERCRRRAMWGLGVCQDHGGRDPERHAELRKRLEGFSELITLESMLARLLVIMDTTDDVFYGEDGKLLQPADWPPEAFAVLASVKVLNWNEDPTDGAQQRVVEIKSIDRRWAYELAAKIAGLLVDRQKIDAQVQHEHRVSQPLVDALLEAQTRVRDHQQQRLAAAPIDAEVVPAAPAHEKGQEER